MTAKQILGALILALMFLALAGTLAWLIGFWPMIGIFAVAFTGAALLIFAIGLIEARP